MRYKGTEIDIGTICFKEICTNLHKAHKENGGKLSYDHILSMMLDSECASMLRNQIDKDDVMVLGVIGYLLDITRERARQLEIRGMRKISNPKNKITQSFSDYILIE